MAFKPAADQNFLLSTKQKGKVLGIKQDTQGIGLDLLSYTAKDTKQVFRFANANGFFWITMPAFSRHLAVHAASQDNNIPIIAWKWEPDREHLMFDFIPAGSGFYRIRARHSQKFFTVNANSALVQYEYKNDDSQLFLPILSPDQDPSSHPVFYETKTDLERTIYLSLIGKIPEAGQALGFIVGYFWKEKDTLSDFWEMMKNYVDVRVRQLILESELQFLKDELVGHLDLLADIKFFPRPKNGDRVQGVIDSMIKNARHFTDKSVQVLPYLVAYGTILVVLKKSMCDNWNQLFPDIPETNDIKISNLFSLSSTIQQFTAAVEKSKTELMKWRMDKIEDAKKISPSGVEQAQLVDNYEGQRQAWLSPRYREGSPDFYERAQYAVKQRKEIATLQFTLALEEMTKAAKYWKYFNPINPLKHITTTKVVGLFGGLTFATKLFSTMNNTFDKIDFYGRNGALFGLELFLKNKSYGLLGTSTNQKTTLELGANEYISSVYGYSKLHIDALWMCTNKGRKVGMGTYGNGDSNNYFCADLPDSFNAKLFGITVLHSESYRPDKVVEQIAFHWQYDDVE